MTGRAGAPRSNGKTSSAARPSRRQHERRPAELPVLIEDAVNRVRGRVRFDATDVSLGGAFLRSSLLFEVGEELSLEFSLPGGHRIHARGRVVRVSRECDHGRVPGMGIAFVALADEDRAAVRAFVAAP